MTDAAAHDYGMALARLSALEGFARALTTGVVPIVALKALGGKAAVSRAYLIGACLTLLVTLNLGNVERRLPRRWVISFGIGCVVVAAVVYASATGALFAVAIAISSVAASIFAACLALYLMDTIDRRDLARTEARRIANHGWAWLVGPSLGLWAAELGAAWPFALSGAVALVALGYFWTLRPRNVAAARNRLRAESATPLAPTTNPLRTVPRFFRQRPLRVAYMITTTRSVFWAAVFIYGPIYVVEAGLPTWVGGAVLSIASSLLLFSPVVSRLAARRGTRWVITRAFAAIVVGALLLAVIGDAQPIGLAAWGIAALGGAALDVVGNVPFMRSVRPRDRVPMTGVFTTWREVSALIAPGLASVALAIGSFRLFYVAIAGLAAAAAAAATFLPRRM